MSRGGSLNPPTAPFAPRKGREQAQRCERGMHGEGGGVSSSVVGAVREPPLREGN